MNLGEGVDQQNVLNQTAFDNKLSKIAIEYKMHKKN